MKYFPLFLRRAFFFLAVLTGISNPAAAEIEVEISKGTMVHLSGSASVVSIANPDIANVDVLSPEIISVQGRGVGQTSVVAYDGSGNEILNETVTVTHNLSALNKIAKSSLPGMDIKFESIDGALIMSGTVESPLAAENIRRLAEPFLAGDRLVNMLTVEGSDQVMLKVKVAEVSRTELKRFGINLSSIISDGGEFAFGLVNGRDLGAGAVDSIIRNAGDGSIAANYDNGDVNINSVIDALAQDDLVTILAEPTLTTTSGRTANFLAGGEFPIPVPGDEGTITIEWREFGVRLDFTPQVLTKNKISLTVAPEVSELSQIGAIELQGFNIPSLSIRRASTTVELGSGQSFAIAGLLQHDHSNNVEKFPGLGDLPILGALFRSNEFRNDQTELMILVTPYIVRGVPSELMHAPTDGLTPPSDSERIIQGRQYHPEPLPAPPAAPGDETLADSPVIVTEEVTTTPAHPVPPAPARPPVRLRGPVGFMLP